VYDPSEILSDAIATVVFMPSKYDRTTIQLAEKFNGTIDDLTSMSNLVDSLVEQCLKEEQFVSLAGRFCAYLAQHVTVENEGQTLKSLLVKKLNALSSQCENILAANEKRVHSILSLLVDIYLQLVVVSDPAVHKWKRHDATLGGNVTHILNILFNNGSPTNVQVAAQKLKLCGQTLEGEEKYVTVVDASQSEEANVWSENPAPKMDSLMSVVATLSSNSGLHEDLRKDLSSLVDTRTNEQWASAEADNIKAKEEAARALSKPAPRKSAAIKIEPDPNDVKTRTPTVPLTVSGGGELTEEEMKFMADAIGNEDNSDDGENDLEEAEFGGMTEDIADAYEQFLAEQSKNGGP